MDFVLCFKRELLQHKIIVFLLIVFMRVSIYNYVQNLKFLIVYAGKTLLAKAVANQTSATFLRVVGSELIQKYLVSPHNESCLSFTDHDDVVSL